MCYQVCLAQRNQSEINNSQALMSSVRQNAIKTIKTKGEFITQIIFPGDAEIQDKVVLQGYQSLVELKKMKVNIESLQSCLIQYVYSYFICKWYGLVLLNTGIAIDQSQLELKQPLNIYILCDIGDSSKVEQNTNDQLYTMIQTILDTQKKFSISDKDWKQGGFVIFWEQYQLIRKLQKVSAKLSFIYLLQETELFRKFSNLLKIKNCSILHYIQTRNKMIFMVKQSQLIKSTMILLNQSTEKKQFKSGKVHYLRTKVLREIKDFIGGIQLDAKWIQENPENYFLKCQILFSEKEYSFEKIVRQNLKQIFKTTPSNLKFAKQKFHIEYCCQGSFICVKYITNFVQNLEYADFFIYQCNNLSFQNTSINLEFHEQITQDKHVVKYIAYKATYFLQKQQSPLERILLMVDIVTVTAKIMEPFITKNYFSYKELLNPTPIHQIINHYATILTTVGKKLYEKQQQNKHAS